MRDSVESGVVVRRTTTGGGAVMRFSLGLGLTNACNLSCAHCYRDVGPAQYLTLADVRRVLRLA